MTFYIQNTETDLVLDVKGGDGGDGQVIMFTYHGRSNQLWEYKTSMIYSKVNG
jgi:GTPase involved in cell partitioning and DNA repair